MAHLKNANGWQMSSAQLLRALGFESPTSPIPPEHESRHEIDGTIVIVKKRDPNLPRYAFKQRVFAICQCGKEVPAGRLHQHMRAVSCIAIRHQKTTRRLNGPELFNAE